MSEGESNREEDLEGLRDLLEHMAIEVVEFEKECTVTAKFDGERGLPRFSIQIAQEDHLTIHELIKSFRYIVRAAARRRGFNMVDIYFHSGRNQPVRSGR